MHVEGATADSDGARDGSLVGRGLPATRRRRAPPGRDRVA